MTELRATPPLWNEAGDLYLAASRTVPALPPGNYKLVVTGQGYAVKATEIAADNLLELPDMVATDVVAEFAAFWGLRERFRSRGLLHKRGFLLWGPPGSGKTASVLLMTQAIVRDHGGIVCQIDRPDVAAECLSMIRSIEPERPIVAVMEDLDALVSRHKEDQFLSLLDGENQVDRIVYLATTNYPKRLDKRFTDRPSRFDTIREVGMPSPAARRQYLLAKDPTIGDVEHWVDLSHTFSVAHLRELIILVQCFGVPLPEAADRVHKMRNRKLLGTAED